MDGRALVACFRDAERVDEASAYRDRLLGHGFTDLRTAELVNEGEGDYLLVGDLLLAGTGFRSDPRSQGEAQEFFGRPVISLTLVDPNYFHLDTALTVLDEETIASCPPAFSSGSRAVLEGLFPDVVIADDADAAVFGLNATSDGLGVVLPHNATGLTEQLRDRGFRPTGVTCRNS